MQDAEEDFATPIELPHLSTLGSLAELQGTLLVIPESLKFLNDALKKEYEPVVKAQILIKKKFIQRLDPDEYIEDEHLYSATGDAVYNEAVSSTLDIISYGPVNILVVKNYDTDKVNYNLIAQLLLKEVTVPIVSVTPGQIPHEQLICTISAAWDTQYDELPPPFVITGITAALITAGKTVGKEVMGLVLQSEGVPGFEKVNEYSIGEIATLLKRKLHLYDKFDSNVEKSVQYGKSVNNLGLYL